MKATFDNLHTENARWLAVLAPRILAPEYSGQIAAVLTVAGGSPKIAAIGELKGVTV